MKFRHTIHVFIDNFAVTYKQLLYRLVIALIAIGLYAAILTPFVNAFTGSPDFVSLTEGIKSFLKNLVEGKPTELGPITEQIKSAFQALLRLISDNRGDIAWGIAGVVTVHVVERFFAGLGNYATAAVINDRMALRADSPFMVTLIRNFKQASLYNLIYVPLSLAYDYLCFTLLYFFVFRLLAMLPFVFLVVEIFLYITFVVITIAFKMVFTTDWLPALIRGKATQKKAFLYTFDRRRKNTFNVLSNFIVLIILVFAINVAAIVFTFGVAALLTIPSSYVILLCFEFVNYYDREELKYFIDKKTIIKPEKEHVPTREEFFKGE